MSNYKKPIWLEEIVKHNPSLKMESRVNDNFIMIGRIVPKNKKIRVAILRDGPFLPVMTGASASILGMISSLIKNNIEVVLIKCLRKNDNIALYKKQCYPTIFIDEESFYGGKSVLFLGNLNYEPNIQALKIIKKFIAPKIKRDILAAGNFGYNIKKEISSKGIKFLGRVDDLSLLFNQCSVALAPLITGSGTRLKILDYLAAGLPVVGTDLSIEGLEPEVKKYVIVENDFSKYPYYIENIKKIYSVEKSISARSYVLENRVWDNVISDIIQVYSKLMLKNSKTCCIY